MNTPFDLLAALLDRLHKRSPIAAYLVALAIAAGAMMAIAMLNQDGASGVPHIWSL
ncbi:MAG: hypothetical protein V4801_02560 [Burkholderia gladioli]